MISIIHPSRGRPVKSAETMRKWLHAADGQLNSIVSADLDDPKLTEYRKLHNHLTNQKPRPFVLISPNKSCVDAINNAANLVDRGIMVVVSDDTDCFPGWDTALLKELEGKEDYLLKTDDGIQDYIVTMTVMDRKYFERDGYIYHPSYEHLFADTEQTCVADMRGRLIKSKLKFPHLHYSNSGGKELPDELNKRNDATWKSGQDNFIKRYKRNFDLKDFPGRITDPSMNNWLKRMAK